MAECKSTCHCRQQHTVTAGESLQALEKHSKVNTEAGLVGVGAQFACMTVPNLRTGTVILEETLSKIEAPTDFRSVSLKPRDISLFREPLHYVVLEL